MITEKAEKSPSQKNSTCEGDYALETQNQRIKKAADTSNDGSAALHCGQTSLLE